MTEAFPMSDRYVHLAPERLTVPDQHNLVALARHLILRAAEIESAGGLSFGLVDMAPFRPLPGDIAGIAGPLPPLAHAPLAGIAALPGEDWPAYLLRAFGLSAGSPFMHWLQSDLWAKTEPSPVGAGLRIAYVLDYGVPHDHVEIAMGQAYTDYDSNGFLWERLNLSLFEDENPSKAPAKIWPKWIGAVDLNRIRAEIVYDAGNLVPNLIENGIARPDEIEGCSPAGIDALQRRFGPMPESYRAFLALVGQRSGLLVDRTETWIHADQLDDVDRMARERIFGAPEPGDDPVPRDAIFIGARAGEHPWFVLSGPRADSPVFRFDTDTGKVTQAGIGVWSWVEALVRDMRPDVRLRRQERETVDALLALSGEITARIDAAQQPVAARPGGTIAAWTILVSGVLLVAGSLAWKLWLAV